jgi:hypothetical protein
MFMLSNRDRRWRCLWSETGREKTGPQPDTLVVVCLFSLIGLTVCLLVAKPAVIGAIFHSRAIAISVSAIIAAAICAVLVAAGRSDA